MRPRYPFLGCPPAPDDADVKHAVASRLDSEDPEHVRVVPDRGELVVYVSHPRACAGITEKQYRGIQQLVHTLLDRATDYSEQGVWLTVNGKHNAQSWANGMPPKLEVRLEFELDRDDPKLHLWRQLANDHHVAVNWYVDLDAVGGGGHSDEWYVYLGRLPVRDDSNRHVPPLVRVTLRERAEKA